VRQLDPALRCRLERTDAVSQQCEHGDVDPDDPPEIEDGPVLAPDTVRRLAVECSTRLISPALRRALKRRDGGCRFPGCPNTRFVDAHHVDHWADGGETRLDSLVLLCARHHGHLHEGGCRIERTPDGLRFLDRFGVEIPATAERRSRGNVVDLMAAQRNLGIDHRTTTPDMGWERSDYPYILSVIRPWPVERASRGATQ